MSKSLKLVPQNVSKTYPNHPIEFAWKEDARLRISFGKSGDIYNPPGESSPQRVI
jgi:hypothetical protein